MQERDGESGREEREHADEGAGRAEPVESRRADRGDDVGEAVDRAHESGDADLLLPTHAERRPGRVPGHREPAAEPDEHASESQHPYGSGEDEQHSPGHEHREADREQRARRPAELRGDAALDDGHDDRGGDEQDGGDRRCAVRAEAEAVLHREADERRDGGEAEEEEEPGDEEGKHPSVAGRDRSRLLDEGLGSLPAETEQEEQEAGEHRRRHEGDGEEQTAQGRQHSADDGADDRGRALSSAEAADRADPFGF